MKPAETHPLRHHKTHVIFQELFPASLLITETNMALQLCQCPHPAPNCPDGAPDHIIISCKYIVSLGDRAGFSLGTKHLICDLSKKWAFKMCYD
jgi:hypothetical protein